MESEILQKRKYIQKEPTNAIICEPNGAMTQNGIRLMCPHCKTVYTHQNGPIAINIWTVGATELRECMKCRKRFNSITLIVPPNMTPESFYRMIFPAGASDPQVIALPERRSAQPKSDESQISLFDNQE